MSDAFIPPHFLMGVGASIVTYYATYFTVDKLILPQFKSSAFYQNLEKLTPGKRTAILTIFPSTVHAAVHCFGLPTLIALGYSEGHNLHKIAFYDEVWPAFYQGFFAGYMIADYTRTYEDLEPAYVVHHVASCAAWILSGILRSMQWQTTLLQFCEFSTFFLNLRQFFLTSGYPSDGTTMTVTNLVFFFTFTAVRVVPLPMILREWVTSGFRDMRAKDGLAMATVGTMFTMIHTGLQTAWFGMMLKKLIQVVTGSDGKHKNKGEEKANGETNGEASTKKED
eukprot:CAMPEP_0113630974 /NCGR_PEP_ID=MMETSP0017_2-20120614/16097_1 /TAXON_ID=2856 /ORGANISM="Cylindrotheca closterium" /LENGTH=280 /DNA_ID=CAMNT_0000541467 /DNA_START=1 /DNA_END=843 /DNA_ORIENTATION=+ /assembly_acc=CAM_ASM_000147